MSLALRNRPTGLAGHHQEYHFEDVDKHKTEDAEVMQRSNGLPNVIDGVGTGPHRQFSYREK